MSVEMASPGELSECAAVVNLLKFVVGFAIVTLPYATMQIGWLASVLGMAVVAFLSVCGIFFAVMAGEKLEALADNHPSEEDPLVRVSSSGWQDNHHYGVGGFFERVVGGVLGRNAQLIFAFSIVVYQFVTIVVYIDVISSNIELYFHTAGHIHLPVLVVLAGILCSLSIVPTLQGVAVLSGFGLSLYVLLFAGLLHDLFPKVVNHTLPSSVHALSHGSIGDWFAMNSFAFAGFPIAVIMYDEMRDRSAMYKVTSVSYAICWMVYSLFAFVGYLCYGANTQLLVYLNLPAGSIWRNSSAGALAAILTCSYVIQAVPLFNCAKNALERIQSHEKGFLKGVPPVCSRWFVVLCSVVFAYVAPNVRFAIDTMGAVSGVVSSFIFPCVVYLALSSRKEVKERVLCCAVILLGLLGLYFSLVTAPESSQRKDAVVAQTKVIIRE